jgi:hypothetical protein
VGVVAVTAKNSNLPKRRARCLYGTKTVRYDVQRQTLPHVYCLPFWKVSLYEDTRKWQHGTAEVIAADRR